MTADEGVMQLGSKRADQYLRDAVGASIALADEVRVPAPVLEGLTAAAGFLLQRDPNLARIGRTAAYNEIASFSEFVAPRLATRWKQIVESNLRPVTDLIAAILGETLPAAEGLDRLFVASYPEVATAGFGFMSDPRGAVWAHCESLARTAFARAELELAPPGEDVFALLKPAALRGADRTTAWLIGQVHLGFEGSETKPPPMPPQFARQLATQHEAIADALLNPTARRITHEIHSDDFLGMHVRLIDEVAGPPLALPIAVLSSDRWFRELRPDRQDARGVHIREQAILLARSVGEAAMADKEVGRLNQVLVHELIHATQRARRHPPRPPYDARIVAIETKILEGLTEHFTAKVIERARDTWSGPAPNPYAGWQPEPSAYHGYVVVCLAAIEVGAPQGLPETFLRELSHNPHKLTMFAELLTGKATPEIRGALAGIFESLFALAESPEAVLGAADDELSELTRGEFRTFEEQHR